MRSRLRAVAVLGVVLAAGMLPAEAIHFYRGPSGGCTPASGDTSDQAPPGGPVAATVLMLHNTFNDAATGSPVTRVRAGQAVKWTWNSAHCHSVTGTPAFASGFHYPSATPASPNVVPGFFDYPVPETSAGLTFTHTFTTPGTYTYTCVHHGAIGMNGVVQVEPADPTAPAAVPVSPIPSPTSITAFRGSLYAASFATGSVYRMLLLPAGLLGPPVPYVSGLSSPLGIAFAPDGTLFASDSHPSSRPNRTTAGRVWAVPPGGGNVASVGQVVIDELPNGRHNTNGMAVKNGRLYITNGNSTDDGVEGGEPEKFYSGTLVSLPVTARGIVLGSTPATGLTLEASGMRNVYDVAFRPGTPEAWIPMNGLDLQDPWGEDLLLKVNVKGATADFGFPGCVYATGFVPNYQQNTNPAVADICDGTQVLPETLMGLHVSANGLAFGPQDAFWGGDLFVTEFGNFFGDDVVGHKVVRVPIDGTGAASAPVDFLIGGTPLDVAFSGSNLYVADFGGGIFLVKPTP